MTMLVILEVILNTVDISIENCGHRILLFRADSITGREETNNQDIHEKGHWYHTAWELLNGWKYTLRDENVQMLI